MQRLVIAFAPEELEAVAAFYRTPLGTAMAERKRAAATREAQQKMEANAAEILQSLEASPERKAAVDEVIDAVNSSRSQRPSTRM